MHYIFSFAIILAAFAVWIVFVQRSLDGMDENIRNAMSQIGIQMSSQCELLSTLLELTNWYAAEECGAIIKTMKDGRLITKGSLAKDVKKQEKIMEQAKAQIMEAAEGCPDLKSDPGYLKAMNAVHQYEKMLQTSKLIYNDSAEKLNQAIHMLPVSIIAGILGFSHREYFEPGG